VFGFITLISYIYIFIHDITRRLTQLGDLHLYVRVSLPAPLEQQLDSPTAEQLNADWLSQLGVEKVEIFKLEADEVNFPRRSNRIVRVRTLLEIYSPPKKKKKKKDSLSFSESKHGEKKDGREVSVFICVVSRKRSSDSGGSVRCTVVD